MTVYMLGASCLTLELKQCRCYKAKIEGSEKAVYIVMGYIGPVNFLPHLKTMGILKRVAIKPPAIPIPASKERYLCDPSCILFMVTENSYSGNKFFQNLGVFYVITPITGQVVATCSLTFRYDSEP